MSTQFFRYFVLEPTNKDPYEYTKVKILSSKDIRNPFSQGYDYNEFMIMKRLSAPTIKVILQTTNTGQGYTYTTKPIHMEEPVKKVDEISTVVEEYKKKGWIWSNCEQIDDHHKMLYFKRKWKQTYRII